MGTDRALPWAEPNALPMWTVYCSPRDFPGKYVVRRWVVGASGAGSLHADDAPTAVVDTLEEARAAVPEGLYCQPRQEDEDPVIVEVWF